MSELLGSKPEISEKFNLSDSNGHIVYLNRQLVKAVATRIKEGVSPDKIIEEPTNVLSGEQQYIIVKRKPENREEPDGILVPINVYKLLKKVKNEWALGKNGDVKFWQESEERKTPVFAVLEDRYDQAIGEFLYKKRITIPDAVAVPVPIEKWAYYVEISLISQTMQGERIMRLF